MLEIRNIIKLSLDIKCFRIREHKDTNKVYSKVSSYIRELKFSGFMDTLNIELLIQYGHVSDNA